MNAAKEKGKSLPIIIVLIIANLSIPLSTCSNLIHPKDSPEMPPRGFFMGILPLPREGQDFSESYLEAAHYVEFVPIWGRGAGSGFWDFTQDLSGSWATLFVDQLVRGNGMFPIIHFSFMAKGADGKLILQTPDHMDGATLSDPAWRELYKQSVLDGIRASKPLYLSVGNEVNRWYEEYGAEAVNPNGFQHFVSLYEELYDAAKELSPETIIFCVFSREIVNELREADLDVLNFFDPAKLDVLVFTSYPNSVRKDQEGEPLASPFNSPSDIPDDYYSRILDYMPGKLFGFSEIAWPSTDAFGGEQGQAEFIMETAGRLTKDQGMNLHLFGWPWLHDLDENDDFGLITHDGREKAAYTTWKNLSSSEEGE